MNIDAQRTACLLAEKWHNINSREMSFRWHVWSWGREWPLLLPECASAWWDWWPEWVTYLNSAVSFLCKLADVDFVTLRNEFQPIKWLLKGVTSVQQQCNISVYNNSSMKKVTNVNTDSEQICSVMIVTDLNKSLFHIWTHYMDSHCNVV